MGITGSGTLSKAYIPLRRNIPGVGGWRWAMPPTPKFALEIQTCWYILALPNAKIFVSPDAKLKICVSPDASQWNIGGVGSSGVGHVYFMYISCILHVVCASFSALAKRKLADAKAVFIGIWALFFFSSV